METCKTSISRELVPTQPPCFRVPKPWWSIPAFLASRRSRAPSAVGKIKRGKGTKIMAIADRPGLPVAACIASTSPHEVTLVEQTLDHGLLLDDPLRDAKQPICRAVRAHASWLYGSLMKRPRASRPACCARSRASFTKVTAAFGCAGSGAIAAPLTRHRPRAGSGGQGRRGCAARSSAAAGGREPPRWRRPVA